MLNLIALFVPNQVFAELSSSIVFCLFFAHLDCCKYNERDIHTDKVRERETHTESARVSALFDYFAAGIMASSLRTRSSIS